MLKKGLWQEMAHAQYGKRRTSGRIFRANYFQTEKHIKLIVIPRLLVRTFHLQCRHIVQDYLSEVSKIVIPKHVPLPNNRRDTK